MCFIDESVKNLSKKDISYTLYSRIFHNTQNCISLFIPCFICASLVCGLWSAVLCCRTRSKHALGKIFIIYVFKASFHFCSQCNEPNTKKR